MNNTEEVSNTFFVHSFIVIAFLILIFGAISAIILIKVIGNILSTGSTSNSPALIVIGIVCVVFMPYCFRIVKSLRILEISNSGSEKRKLILHPPIFVNDINYPDEIELSQITDITQDKIFGNLVEFTFIENREKQKINSFIKKGKLDVIQKLLSQQNA